MICCIHHFLQHKPLFSIFIAISIVIDIVCICSIIAVLFVLSFALYYSFDCRIIFIINFDFIFIHYCIVVFIRESWSTRKSWNPIGIRRWWTIPIILAIIAVNPMEDRVRWNPPINMGMKINNGNHCQSPMEQ